jgi:hypothetical protein
MGFNSHKMIGATALSLGLILSTGAMSAKARNLQDPNPSASAPSQEMKKERSGGQATTVSGKVTAASATEITIMDANNTEHKIKIAGDTKVMKGGKDATAADLKPNDTVTVQTKKDKDGSQTAVSINIEGE